MTPRLKVYGERNTSTNYFSKLIQLNLDADEVPGTLPRSLRRLQRKLPCKETVRDLYFKLAYAHTLGWKHTRARPAAQLAHYPIVTHGLRFVTLTKNPYSWLLSLHRNPYHQRGPTTPDFAEFLTTPWKTVGRDNCPRTLPSPIALWNLKNASYLGLDESNTLHLTTEGLFEDPGAVLHRVSDRLSIPRRSDTFIDYESPVKNKHHDSQYNPAKDNRYYRDYYLNERWRADLAPDTLAIINQTLDQDLMHRFGYTRLTS